MSSNPFHFTVNPSIAALAGTLICGFLCFCVGGKSCLTEA
jgi:hypothetical protein